MMIGLAAAVGFLPLTAWQIVAAITIGAMGVVVGFFGEEMRARNYFQGIALVAGMGLLMALGAVLTGASALFGVPLTVGSFVLFVIVLSATFFAGFEPEALEERPELATQNL